MATTRDVTGGYTVSVIEVPRPFVGLRLLSDLHLDSAFCDRARLTDELDQARDADEHILINGDVWDAVLPRDKRYSPGTTTLNDSPHPLNEMVMQGFGVLSPYADRIDMVGVGNHEAAIERVHAYSMTQALIEKLGHQTDHFIRPGGYNGLLVYRLHDGRKVRDFRLLYHHGAGKGSAVRAAVDGLLKLGQITPADLYWRGHTHKKLYFAEQIIRWNGKKALPEDAHYVSTPGFLRGYIPETSAKLLKEGRRSSYVAESQLPPHPLGGASVFVGIKGNGLEVEVRL